MVARVNTALQPVEESSLASTTSSPAIDILADFLRLKISANTSRNYSKAIADFCRLTYNSEVSIDLLERFLGLSQPEAVYQALQYRQLLINAKLC
jgi:integrase/recombinase XerC